jgi:hypothetical protein
MVLQPPSPKAGKDSLNNQNPLTAKITKVFRKERKEQNYVD